MKTGTKIALAGTAIGLTLIGASYYNGANNLSVTPVGVSWVGFDNSGNVMLNVTVSVKNDSFWAYPVPSITADLYSGADHLAAGNNPNWQWISGNGSTNLVILATIAPADLTNFLASVIANETLPGNLTIKGNIALGFYNLPINSTILQI